MRLNIQYSHTHVSKQLEMKVSQQASRIRELELLTPGEDGQYKGLKQELKELEKVIGFMLSRRC